ncbi:hypothetical protein M422DRAFT_22694 [Sphaerobolus stellatus SS14]|nr:hypothetical protein M422DRAFT_22694 [Sphaerobolus stellatus SS14]
MTVTTRAYRSVLRELRKSSIFPRVGRNPAITANIRVALFPQDVPTGTAQTRLLKAAENTAAFLRADKLYKDLLDRYAPLRDITEEERVKATANRVGLNTPKTYKP